MTETKWCEEHAVAESYEAWYPRHFTTENARLVAEARKRLGPPGTRWWDYDLRLVEVLPATEDRGRCDGVPREFGGALGMVPWFELQAVAGGRRSYMDLSRLARHAPDGTDARGADAEAKDRKLSERLGRS
jgi:hypothetical protein